MKCTVGEPSIMWLSGLTIPESYLAAVVQMECQKHFWPLERSTFYTTVTPYTSYDEISGRPEKVSQIKYNPTESSRVHENCINISF